MARGARDIYRGQDPLCVPAYGVAEAARYLGLPAPTVRSWVVGRSYPVKGGARRFPAVIRIADPAGPFLSFQNLVEVHVLGSIRRKHQVQLEAVRKAIGYLERHFESRHPLADVQMRTDGSDLFVERYGQLIAASREGQVAMRTVLEGSLRRIERDPAGAPIRLFPFTTSAGSDDDHPVAIDPRLQFGRPCITGTGVPTEEVAERFRAGDTMRDLAADFRCPEDRIEAAIRYELGAAA